MLGAPFGMEGNRLYPGSESQRFNRLILVIHYFSEGVRYVHARARRGRPELAYDHFHQVVTPYPRWSSPRGLI